jgi:predicted transcriptional regulator
MKNEIKQKKEPLSKDQQCYYRATIELILRYINNNPDEWTLFIFSSCVRGRSTADYRKTMQILKQLEFDGKVSKYKKATNNYVWNITSIGKEFLESNKQIN